MNAYFCKSFFKEGEPAHLHMNSLLDRNYVHLRVLSII